MTTEYQLTRQEEAYRRLLEEKKEMLSWAARAVLAEATRAAYEANMMHNGGLQPEKYDEAMEKMHLAAAGLTGRDCELLAEFVKAGYLAALSIDSNDVRPAGYRVYGRDVHWYYRMVSGMVEEIVFFYEETRRPSWSG
jgi:hypothetical protein